MRGMETKRMKGRLQRMECFRRPWLSERKGKFSYRGFRLARRSRGSSSSSGFSHGNRLDGFHGLSVVGFDLTVGELTSSSLTILICIFSVIFTLTETRSGSG